MLDWYSRGDAISLELLTDSDSESLKTQWVGAAHALDNLTPWVIRHSPVVPGSRLLE